VAESPVTRVLPPELAEMQLARTLWFCDGRVPHLQPVELEVRAITFERDDLANARYTVQVRTLGTPSRPRGLWGGVEVQTTREASQAMCDKLNKLFEVPSLPAAPKEAAHV
jgi:hypothetical protein